MPHLPRGHSSPKKLILLLAGFYSIAVMFVAVAWLAANSPQTVAMGQSAIKQLADYTRYMNPIGKFHGPSQQQDAIGSTEVAPNGKDRQKLHSPTPTPTPSSSQGPSGQSTGPTTNMIGIYDTSSPSDPTSLTHLDDLAQAGFNVVLNYTAWDGSVSQIKTYLDHAAAKNIKVIFSLKDFYDQEQNQQVPLSDVKQFGTTYEQVALNIVQSFKDHPAIYGWYISDERPETPDDLPTWLPILQDRTTKIKQIDPTHPTITVLQCYPGTFLNDQTNVAKMAGVTDQLGFDNYPVPYSSLDQIGQCASTFSSAEANPSNSWAVIQDFSWSSYPDVLSGQHLDPSQARFPTLDELKQMVSQAKRHGVSNFLLYSYFDLQASPQFSQHWQDVKSLIQSLPTL